MTTRRFWTAEEDAILRALYADTLTADVAERVGRTAGSVHRRARVLGLSKSVAWIAKTARDRIEQDPQHGGRRTQFTSGQTPFNKGMKRPDGWAPGRMRETQFRRGRAPHEARNYRAVGSLRISKDGYVEVKVSDDLTVAPSRRWMGVHRKVWEQSNGPIPPGHAVTFKAGRMTTDPAAITLDALELVSRSELMRRNSVHQYPPEIVKVSQLRGAISRQINKRARHEQEQH